MLALDDIRIAVQKRTRQASLLAERLLLPSGSGQGRGCCGGGWWRLPSPPPSAWMERRECVRRNVKAIAAATPQTCSTNCLDAATKTELRAVTAPGCTKSPPPPCSLPRQDPLLGIGAVVDLDAPPLLLCSVLPRTVFFSFRSAYQPPVSSIFLSEQTSNQPAVLFSQNKSAPATSQTNRLFSHARKAGVRAS